MSKSKKMVLGVIICVVVLIALIIIFHKPKYTVTFNSDGGTVVTAQTVKKGDKAVKPTAPEKEGYIFLEWTYNGKTYDFTSSVTGNITLVARYEKMEEDSVVVTFDTGGGNTIVSQVLKKGEVAFQPVDPTKEGYTFKGWTLDGKEYDFKEQVEEDITLVATWEKVEEKQETKTNTNTNTNTQTKPSTNTNTNTNTNTKPTTPTQPSTTETYTVTFNSNGGSAVASKTVKSGEKVARPSNPTKEGYTLSAWTLNGSNYDFNSVVTGNITLVAKWTQKTYRVTSTPVDAYSPDVVLRVTENGTAINVKEVRYSDGVLLCSGSNMTVNKNDILGENSFIVVLNGGTHVTATMG